MSTQNETERPEDTVRRYARENVALEHELEELREALTGHVDRLLDQLREERLLSRRRAAVLAGMLIGAFVGAYSVP